MSDLDALKSEWTTILQDEAAEYTQDRWRVQFDDKIKPDKQNRDWKQYIRNTFGWFKCSKCKRTWPSNGVTVVFHYHLNKKHRGTVKVRLYRQNCKFCKNAPMEEPTIDTENIEILMENLVKNIRWKIYHEDTDKVESDAAGRDVQSPHEPDHCEGCKAGICRLGDAARQRNPRFHRSRR